MPMVFPDDPSRDCDEWCAPLHLVEHAVARKPWARLFHPDDFMIMGRIERSGPRITLYKHIITRRYLNVADDGRTFAYRPVDPEADNDNADYAPITLRAAVTSLELLAYPWAGL